MFEIWFAFSAFSLAVVVVLALLIWKLRSLSGRVRALESTSTTTAAQTSPESPPPLPKILPTTVRAAAEIPPRFVSAKPARSAIDWESFLGVKLFAWLGGFVLFLGVVFLVKYSFENNLITPLGRVTIGAVIGLALIAAGWFATRRNRSVPGQSLCATGILILYADVFAAHVFYELISATTAFAAMSAITIAAFAIAVQLDAQVVVVLGLLGGFLTPPLLMRQDQNVFALFSYIFLLNCGVGAVALRKRWEHLVLLSAIGTIATELSWPPFYHAANATHAAAVFLLFELQFLAIFFYRNRTPAATAWPMRAAVAAGSAALAFAVHLVDDPLLAARAPFVFAFIFLADIGLLLLAATRPEPQRLSARIAGAVFLLLASWTSAFAAHAPIWLPLTAFVLFALLHAGFAVWPRRSSSFARGRASAIVREVIVAALPFVLLCTLGSRVHLANPTPIFLVALLLYAILLSFGILARTSWIALVALVCNAAVEGQWHALNFSAANAAIPLIWYLAFFVLFFGYPFFARDRQGTLAWATSSLGGLVQFWFVYHLVAAAYPTWRNGFLPAIFIVPYALGVLHLIKRERVSPASGDARLAWQAGAALLFVTLIFPIQFQRESLTLGWALEGLALIVAFRFLPNRAMRIVGAALLATAFVRLALNPAVLEYHRRSGAKIWNWYLYAYGLTTAALLIGARLFQSSVTIALERRAMQLLYSLGAVLAFLLLNIEIADYFSIGPTLTFSFSGNFARDMTYSIAWALFAFVLLLLGMKSDARAARSAGVALLIVTLAKLFLHDLNSLNQLYRIGAFIGVALVLIVASFVYQRFLAPRKESVG